MARVGLKHTVIHVERTEKEREGGGERERERRGDLKRKGGTEVGD